MIARCSVACFLDVGGVLLVPHPDPVVRALGVRALRPRIYDFIRAHFAGVAASDQMSDRSDDRALYLAAYCASLGVDPEAALPTLAELWSGRSVELWRLAIPSSVEDLPVLARHGLALGVVSNSDGTVEEQLRRNRICQVGDGPGVPVSAIIDSANVGCAKPDPGILELGIRAVGIPASDLAYVGDSLRYDVEPAAAAGMTPVHFDPYGMCGQRDHRHVARLGSVATLTLPL